MSYAVERLINHVINDTKKCRTYEKDHCGICDKIVKTDHRAIQCDSCELWGFTLSAMIHFCRNMNN